MSDTSSQNNNSQTTQIAQHQIASTTSTPQTGQQSTMKQGKKPKTPATPSDGLATAVLFVVVGIFAGYFPAYSHTPSIQIFCSAVSYICYAAGFLGGCFEMEKLAKSQFWSSFGLGIVGVILCLGVNWLADITNSIYALSLIIRILMLVPLMIAAYGISRGLLYLVITESAPGGADQQAPSATPQSADHETKTRLTPEQISGLVIAILSALTALIQALPTLLPFIKQILHIP